MTLLEKADGAFSRVTRAWEGRTVICIATGPSLSAEHVALAQAANVPAIVINDAYQIASWASVVYWADAKWWNWHKDLEAFKAFRGQRCTIHSAGREIKDASVHVLRNAGGEGLSTDAGAIMTGSHSGYQAINIATLSGARRVLLLGYDCRQVDGKKHYFGDHPDKSEPPYSTIIARYVALQIPLARLGVEVINCTPGSALKTFPQARLEDVLARVESDKAGAVVSA